MSPQANDAGVPRRQQIRFPSIAATRLATACRAKIAGSTKGIVASSREAVGAPKAIFLKVLGTSEPSSKRLHANPPAAATGFWYRPTERTTESIRSSPLYSNPRRSGARPIFVRSVPIGKQPVAGLRWSRRKNDLASACRIDYPSQTEAFSPRPAGRSGGLMGAGRESVCWHPDRRHNMGDGDGIAGSPAA